MGTDERGDGGEKIAWLRRHAIQMAAQLPEDPADARRVLDLMRDLLEKFIAPTHSGGGCEAKVRQIKGG